jgi:serine protease inhibitor
VNRDWSWETIRMQSRTEADTWAADNTDGLIDRFPLAIDEDTLLVLASALATKVAWWQPFELASVESTPGGAASWPSDVTTVLRSPKHVRRYL